MRLLAIDIETTHAEYEKGCLIQIAAIVFDAKTGEADPDVFDILIDPGEIKGDAYCLAMHHKLFQNMLRNPCPTQENAILSLRAWLSGKGFHFKNQVHPVGFNVGSFDINWLNNIVGKNYLPIHRRAVELGTLLMRKGVDFSPIPSAEAIKLLGSVRTVKHEALQDCRDAIALYKLAMKL